MLGAQSKSIITQRTWHRYFFDWHFPWQDESDGTNTHKYYRRAYYIWPGDEVIRNIICHRRWWWWWQVRSQKCQKIKLKTPQKMVDLFWFLFVFDSSTALDFCSSILYIPTEKWRHHFLSPYSSIHIRWRWFMQIVAPPALRVTASKKKQFSDDISSQINWTTGSS